MPENLKLHQLDHLMFDKDSSNYCLVISSDIIHGITIPQSTLWFF